MQGSQIIEVGVGFGSPKCTTGEWSDFTAECISEHEKSVENLGSRLLGDILQGQKEQKSNEERRGEEYKELRNWVISQWEKHVENKL